MKIRPVRTISRKGSGHLIDRLGRRLRRRRRLLLSSRSIGIRLDRPRLAGASRVRRRTNTSIDRDVLEAMVAVLRLRDGLRQPKARQPSCGSSAVDVAQVGDLRDVIVPFFERIRCERRSERLRIAIRRAVATGRMRVRGDAPRRQSGSSSDLVRLAYPTAMRLRQRQAGRSTRSCRILRDCTPVHA